MKYELTILKQGRRNIIGLLGPFNNEQLNQIPGGFRNNLIWNLGHVMVSQQLLCYQLSGLEPLIAPHYIECFRRGTVPESNVDAETVDELKSQAIELTERFIEDYHKGIFKKYQSYQSLYGVELNNIDDAIVFNNTHEGVHLGYMMAMRNLIA